MYVAPPYLHVRYNHFQEHYCRMKVHVAGKYEFYFVLLETGILL
jgi:hypothetical protein